MRTAALCSPLESTTTCMMPVSSHALPNIPNSALKDSGEQQFQAIVHWGAQGSSRQCTVTSQNTSHLGETQQDSTSVRHRVNHKLRWFSFHPRQHDIPSRTLYLCKAGFSVTKGTYQVKNQSGMGKEVAV